MKSQDLKKLHLPDKPGVYFWKKGRDILYIGKATSLHDRVRSYFARDLINTRGPAIVDMVTIAQTVTYQETDTVLEALILEANLIKQYRPKYNIKEKDNKSFSYVIITREPFPRIGVIRGRTLSVQQQIAELPVPLKHSFGPFPSLSALFTGLRVIRNIFPFRDLKSNNPTHDRFYQQLGLSPSHTSDDAQRIYQKNIRHIIKFFQGNKQGIINDLNRQMGRLAKQLDFEQANIIKKKIFALEHINDIAFLKRDFYEDIPLDTCRIESYDVAHLSGDSTVGVMTVIQNGIIDKASYRKFKIRKLAPGAINDLASLQEIITRRFTHTDWPLPDIVVIDGGETHHKHAKKIMKQLGIDKKISIVAVVKDARHKPRAIIGDEVIIKKYKKQIVLANSESHRFAINYHTLLRNKKFLQ